jgi:hypothetical protein
MELVKALGPETAGPLGGVLMLGVVVIALVGIIQWRKYRQAEMDAALQQQLIDFKQKMVESGMSADEIERVLNAQPAKASQASRAEHK